MGRRRSTGSSTSAASPRITSTGRSSAIAAGGWDDVLPFFKRAERWTGDEAEIHGRGGHLTTSPMTERPAGVPGDHRRGAGARARIPTRTSTIPSGHGGLDRLVPANPRRKAPGERGADLPEASEKAPEPADRHQSPGAPRHLRRQARGRRRIFAAERAATRRCDARGDFVGRRGRLAASAAIIGRRRRGGARQGRHPGAARAAGGRAEFPGPLHRPDVVPC